MMLFTPEANEHSEYTQHLNQALHWAQQKLEYGSLRLRCTYKVLMGSQQ